MTDNRMAECFPFTTRISPVRAIHAVSAILITGLAGCATTEVSPEISRNPGVETGVGAHGYPILISLTLSKPSVAGAKARAECAKSQMNDIEGAPVIAGASVQASAKGSFFFPSAGVSKPFRYSLSISGESGSVYKFDRLRYINDGSQGGQIMASKYFSPEYVVQELESIADNIDACVRNI